MKRAFTFAACVVVGVTLVGSLRVSGQTRDPRIGRWQLNLSKSKFTGTPPKSITRLYEDRGGGIVLYTGTAVTPTGTNVTLVLYKLDGKEYLRREMEATHSGRCGLWSKADSQVLFDDFRISHGSAAK